MHERYSPTLVTGTTHRASHRTTVNEEQAISAVRAGDERAFAVLVDRYQHMVYTVCDRVLRNAHEAEEAAQDSFVKAYQHISGYQGQSKFSTWLYSIAYRTAISKLRVRPVAAADLEDAAHASVPFQHVNDMEGMDRKAALDRALAQLSAEDATIVTLFYLAEQSVEEIVTATGLSASNVKVKLHRSRKKLLELLQQDLKEEAWLLL